MIPKISLTAAFFLMVAPPMAGVSNRAQTNPVPITRQAHESARGVVVAQDDQSNIGTSDNDNDNDSDSNESDSNDSADDNQNADANQMEQQNATGDDQPVAPPIAPQVLNGPENDPYDRPPPNAFSQPIDPNQ